MARVYRLSPPCDKCRKHTQWTAKDVNPLKS